MDAGLLLKHKICTTIKYKEDHKVLSVVKVGSYNNGENLGETMP